MRDGRAVSIYKGHVRRQDIRARADHNRLLELLDTPQRDVLQATAEKLLRFLDTQQVEVINTHVFVSLLRTSVIDKRPLHSPVSISRCCNSKLFLAASLSSSILVFQLFLQLTAMFLSTLKRASGVATTAVARLAVRNADQVEGAERLAVFNSWIRLQSACDDGGVLRSGVAVLVRFNMTEVQRHWQLEERRGARANAWREIDTEGNKHNMSSNNVRAVDDPSTSKNNVCELNSTLFHTTPNICGKQALIDDGRRK